MWMPVFGPLPKPAWFGAALEGRLRDRGPVRRRDPRQRPDVVGDASSTRSTQPGERYWGISPLADQSTAGVLMMIEGTFVALGVLAWLFFELAREGTEKQRLLDLAERARRAARRAPRAARAVAAGHGALLEERLSDASGDPMAADRSLLRARLRRRRRQPRRRDRRGAPAGALLRRLDDRLGEHDRRRARRPVGRLLVRRALRRPPPAPARPLPAGARRRGRCSRSSRSPRAPSSSFSVDAFDTISVGGFAGSLFGVLVLVAVPVILLGAASP